ncbi:MAG: response regulator transcription factor [Burkholderiaceae bacterium]
MKILLVEDDPMIGEAIVQALRDAAYAVDWVQDGEAASGVLERHTFETILLDLALPGRDGLRVLVDVRSRSDGVPIILITAKDSLQDRITGLDLGADDYLVKPFDVTELLARMRAVARRRGGQGTPVMSNGVITLDPATKCASVDEASVQLSRREFALLRELLIRPGAILSRDQLEDRIYGWGEEVESNAVDFIIHGLRRKLGADVIRNVRGLGWNVERGT